MTYINLVFNVFEEVEMKRIIILSLLVSSTYAVDINLYVNGQNCSQILNKGIYVVCYDYGLKGAKYVAYTVNGDIMTSSIHIKSRPEFYPENNIPVKYRSYPNDYIRSGYDRGHMANHADFDYSADAVYLTYSMSNIVPQSPDVNRHTWVKAEKYERLMAKKLGNVSVINGIEYTNNPSRIGKHQIAIPQAFWKIVYNDNKNYKKCFKYTNANNIDVEQDRLRDHEVNCTDLK